MTSKNAIVVGAGIVGLSLARSLALRGYSVTVFDRHDHSVGASVRNFGMIWPIGQPNGRLYERAMHSRSTWKEFCVRSGTWYEEGGSMHLAYSTLEADVLKEVAERMADRTSVVWLNSTEACKRSKGVNPAGLVGGLWSADEMIVEARQVIRKLPGYLSELHKIRFQFGKAVSRVAPGKVWVEGNELSADLIFICTGADFEILYPEVYRSYPFTKCKLQMMRLVAQPDSWRLGPSLCGGLSLIHYKGFQEAGSLKQLREHFELTLPEYLRLGIHVMVAQNEYGELTVGDSHEYGSTPEPFDQTTINELIIAYLKTFACFKDWNVKETWNGTYAKMTSGETEFVFQVDNGVWIVNGLGGAGMTLSFGLAEEVMAKI